MQTQWNLSELFYTSLDDPQIEKDVAAFEEAQEAFAKKYKDTDAYVRDPEVLAQALEERYAIEERALTKPLYYLFFLRDCDAENTKAQALEAKLSERYTKAEIKTTFFDVALAKISKEDQEKLLKAPALEKYTYYLSEVFTNAEFVLSDAEEKIMARKSDVSHSRWTNMVSGLLAKSSVQFQDKDLPLPEALERVPDLPTSKERNELWENITAKLKELSEVSAHELNAVVTNHRINTEIRGYKRPEQPSIRGNENEMGVIDALIDATKDRYTISHDFYNAKAKLFKEDTLAYVDRNAPIGEFETSFTFEKSVEIVTDAFARLNPRYAEIFQEFLANGQIDVYPRKGKDSGGYAAYGINVPSMLFLNHTDSIGSLKTLAHEMGHAIHYERAKQQPAIYQGHSTAVAETASTLFEQVVEDALMEYLPENDKKLLLHESAQNDINTIFRQTAAYRFEQDLHAKIAEEGFLAAKDIAALLNTHSREQMGSAINITENDGYSYVYWSHFRRFFYVYTYVYGKLVSRALFARWKKDSNYAEAIDTFLSRGGSIGAEDIFREAGLSFENGEVFTEGLDQVRADVDRFANEAK